MAKFAVIDGDNVINTILADSKEIAEEVTGKNCIEFTTEAAEVGGTYVDGKFVKKQPYPSWIREGESSWKAPVDKPGLEPEGNKDYIWDEPTINWIEITH